MIIRNLIPAVAILTLVISCKKSGNPSTPPHNVNPVGTWKVVRESSNRDNTIYAVFTSTDKPCMANNQLRIFNDSISEWIYAAMDTCYLVKNQNMAEIFGEKGDDFPGTWKAVGDSVFVHQRGGLLAGKLTAGSPEQLTLSYTLTTPYYWTDTLLLTR